MLRAGLLPRILRVNDVANFSKPFCRPGCNARSATRRIDRVRFGCADRAASAAGLPSIALPAICVEAWHMRAALSAMRNKTDKADGRPEEVRAFIRTKPARKPLPAHPPRERVIVPGPTECACCGSKRLASSATIQNLCKLRCPGCQEGRALRAVGELSHNIEHSASRGQRLHHFQRVVDLQNCSRGTLATWRVMIARCVSDTRV
jgi:hypothetical protein